MSRSLARDRRVDAGDRCFRTGKDDVLGFLHVDACQTQTIEDEGEHTRPIAVSHDQRVRGRRGLRQVHDVGTSPERMKLVMMRTVSARWLPCACSVDAPMMRAVDPGVARPRCMPPFPTSVHRGTRRDPP